jgi:hypothetical protein
LAKCRPTLPEQAGFTEGRQTMEVSECCRLVLQKCTTWGVPCYVLKLDVARAFDALSHELIATSLQEAGCCPKLCLAFLREISCSSLLLCFQGHVFEPICYNKGGRQGGSETPFIWKVALDRIMRRVVSSWAAHGLGLSLPGGPLLTWQGWADDLVLFASSESDLRKMVGVLVSELAVHDLHIKDGSVELMSCLGGGLCDNLVWKFAEGEVRVECKDRLNILGVLLDPAGSTATSIAHRIGLAWDHWHARSRVFLSPRISLRSRWYRLRDTVLRTLLHGAGGWHINEASLHQLEVFETRLLQATLCKHRRSDETEQEFWVRLNRKIRWFKEAFGWVSIGCLAAQYHISWWGHVARHSDGTGLGAIRKWRDLSWVSQNRAQSHQNIVRYARPGPQHHYDSSLVSLCKDWQAKAQNREEWKALRAAKLRELVPHRYFCGSMGPLSVFSNRFSDWSFGSVFAGKGPSILIVSDSRVAVEAVLGKASPGEYPAHCNFMKWCIHALWCWGSRPLGGGDFIMHIDRERNSYADMLANRALDYGNMLEILSRDKIGVGDVLVVSSDGASRGNPGPSSSAAAVCLYRAGVAIPVAISAFCIGHSNSMAAEFEALCLGMHLLVSWLLYSGSASARRPRPPMGEAAAMPANGDVGSG